MAKLSDRTRRLQEMVVTEAVIEQHRNLEYDEAVWRIEHEYQAHIEWAQQRREFMLGEIEDRKPLPARRAKPVPQGPPIVRHAGRNGRVSNGGHFGERFG